MIGGILILTVLGFFVVSVPRLAAVLGLAALIESCFSTIARNWASKRASA